MGILHAVQDKGNFLKMKDAMWTIVSDETARQKIAHAIQYQIRNDFSLKKEGPVVASKAPIPAALKPNVQQSVHEQSVTHNSASVAMQRKLRTPRSLPTSKHSSEPHHFPNDDRRFRADGRFIPPITNEGSYQQWLLEQTEDGRSSSAAAADSDVFGNTKQSRSKIKDHLDPYLQHSNRAATDHIDFSHHMEFVGAHYANSHQNINAMAYDLYSDHRHIIEQNYNRKFPSFLNHMDILQLHQPFGGVLFNDGKLSAPPAPAVHSLDVSGVSQWDGSVDFLENAEYVEVKNDAFIPPHDLQSGTGVTLK
jgi:hypothetical protein